MVRSSSLFVAALVAGVLGFTPQALAGPGGRGGGRAGAGRAGASLPKPSGLPKPGGLPSRTPSGLAGGGTPGAALKGRSGTGPLGGAGPLAAGAGSAAGITRGGSGPLGGDRGAHSDSASGTRSGSASQKSTETASQGGTASDGVSGPRGGSVDVDQTTTGDSVTTTVNAESASGETATHTGTITQEDGYVTYDGQGSTSTGRSSETHAAGAMTDAGLVVGGTTTNNQGSAAGVALVNENGVTAAGIATNGETVFTATTSPASAATSGAYYVYPYPVYGARVYPSAYGTPIYWWAATPVVAATVALAADAIAGEPSSVEAYYSPVVTYATPRVAVYATTYAPRGLYAAALGDRYYWVPGAASSSAAVDSAIESASRMSGPTSGGTVIAYDLDGGTVFLTNEPPLDGVFDKRLGNLHAWMPGVSAPSEAERQAIDTALTTHAQGGSEALAAASARAGQGG